MNRKRLIFFIKLAISAAIVIAVYGKFVGREGSEEMVAHLGDLRYGWIALAAVSLLLAVGCSVLRWERLLVGQGIHAPFRHLFGSFMIGRFFGAFTPGGWSGLNGYRLYDIAVQTGKTARSTATIGIEMVLGNLAFGAVVIAGSLFGLEIIGLQGVLLVDGFFAALITTAIVLISRPVLFRKLSELLPAAIRSRLQTTIDAVCMYQGKGRLVTQAAFLGMGTHAFNNLIYVCTARALGVELGIGEVFFVSAMQIFATLVPASVNGIGLREAAAVPLYVSVGVPASVAFLIPTVGFAVEMAVSAFGGIVFMARRVGYRVDIRVEDPEREDFVHAKIENAPPEAWPRLGRGTAIGAGGGLLGGVLLGIGEGAVILASGQAAPDYAVLLYGAALYGLPFSLAGGALGLTLAYSGRLMKRAAVPESAAFARAAAFMASVTAFGIGAFRVRRDIAHEAWAWKSIDGLLCILGCALAALVLYVVLATAIRLIVERKPFDLALHRMFAATGAGVLLLAAFLFSGSPAEAASSPIERRADAPDGASNVLFIVVDTLRADYLPGYGGDEVATPALDAFSKDAILFEHAFSNASWTRPSFASLMTGRYASSHRTMSKAASLPDEIVTLAESFQQGGYTTAGVVTNYNVAPFFNFHQGFDEYRYLEPDFVLGANDTSAKLLLAEVLKRVAKKLGEAGGRAQRGSAYQDAERVNEAALDFIARQQSQRSGVPFYLFVGYMDPHDPYYPHPYDGTGYSRAANQTPPDSDAPRLRRLYRGEIEYWDAQFGKLIGELERRGLYDDMTIVVTSDHGEEFLEHGAFWHGTTLYDEQVHVPLWLKLPGQAQGGSRVGHWVQSIDIMPSLLQRADLPLPPGVQGKDLMQDSEVVFAEEDHEGNQLRSLRLRDDLREIKVIEANPNNPRGLEPFELYRVDEDPGEQQNAASEASTLLERSAGRLATYASNAEKGRAQESTVDVMADPATVSKLRALGYVDDEAPEPKAEDAPTAE